MERKYKRYLKLNLISLVFIGISFISITLAWFAYSGLAKVDTTIRVKAWNIEFDQKNTKVETNDIVISLDDVYPGMAPVFEKIDIKNLGDSMAQIKYSVTSVRVLNDNLENLGYSEDRLEDILSHEYPFNVNINLSKEFAIAQEGTSIFTVSVSWPLDSGHDSDDSLWGNNAYEFQNEELRKYEADKTYQMQAPLKIVIHLTAEQYIDTNTSVDYNYPMGEIVLFDVVNNERCDSITNTCLKTYVIDPSNKVGDTEVTLLPDLFKAYDDPVTYSNYETSINKITNNWNPLIKNSLELFSVNHLLKVISNDIINSVLVRDTFSPLVIGNLKYNSNVILDSIDYSNRMTAELSRLTGNNYYKFLNENFEYLSTSRCYWTKTESDNDNAYVLVNIDSDNSKIYKESKLSTCNVIPIIKATKENLIINNT